MFHVLRRLNVNPRHFLRPGRALMLALPMRTKLALVALFVMLPLAALVVWSVMAGQQRLRELDNERVGLRTTEQLTALFVHVHQHLAMDQRMLAGEPTAAAAQADLRQALQQVSKALGERLAQDDRHQLLTSWTELATRLQQLRKSATPAEAASVVAEHHALSDALAQLLRLNAERSGLLLDALPVGYFNIELLVSALPPVIDAASRAAVLGATRLDQGSNSASPADRIELLALARQIDHAMAGVQTALLSLERSGQPATASGTPARAAMEAYSTLLRETFIKEQPEAPAAALHSAGREAVMRLVDLHAECAQQLARSLEQRTTEARQQLWVTAAAFLFALGLTAYLFSALYQTFIRSIVALQRSTAAVSSGDLSTRLDLPGRDELAGIGHTVNAMNERLSSLVGEIRSSAARVNMAGTQVAEGSQRLSARTEEQACSLRESVVAIGELSSAVQSNAQAARELDGMTEALAQQATEGQQAMGETLESVQKLQDASRRVFEVVSVIDDVAFQTSMLSLNAAVEAARAGEAGKGFSIVASEVRSLAQRVGESAEEIRSLITLASDQLEFSGEKLGSANQSLMAVASGAHEVSARLRTISQASTEQSDTLVSVAQRVGDLDQITRDNARLVDESTAASQSLLERAQVLRDAVASMKLRHGTADEATDLLDRALAHVTQVGQDQGLKDLHDPELGFIDRDLYIFALDRDGTYIACGAKPALIGINVGTLSGIQGTPFVANVWAAAEAGGGWVQYEIADPLTGAVTEKESYVRLLENGLVLGCGVYRRSNQSGTTAKPRAAAWSRTQESPAVSTT